MTNSVLAMLKLLDTGQVVCFDWSPSEQARLFEDESLLIRHPFPVLHLEDGTYLLLHDSERFRSLSESGIEHIPAQLCNRKSIRLSSPRLALTKFTFGDLQQFVEEHRNLVSLEDPGRDAIRSEYLHLMFEFPRHPSVVVHCQTDNQVGCPESVDQLLRQILNRGSYLPDWGMGHYADTVLRSQTVSGFLTLPTFDLASLERAALSDHLFPPHTIDVQTDRRVFNIDFPISVLKADIPIEEKEQFLRDMVMIREQSCRTTFFEGQVYILNR
jgi:hypothetical protein